MGSKSVSFKMRSKVYNKTNGHCAYCGTPLDLYGLSWDVEHVVPKSAGGDGSIDNLLPSCKTCNSMKNTKTPDEFREYLKIKSLENLRYIVEICTRFYLNDSPILVDGIKQAVGVLSDNHFMFFIDGLGNSSHD